MSRNIDKFNSKNSVSKNYFRCISEKSLIPPANPVIFIFDNEMSNKNKPISIFMDYIKISELNKKNMRKENFCKLQPIGIDKKLSKQNQELQSKKAGWSNLYLMTNQLVGEKEECEIEDLFDEKTQNLIIDGRTFDRKDSYPPNNPVSNQHHPTL